MIHISILSASVRNGRNSHRVALYLKKYIEGNNLASAEIIDLKELNFPLFDERLQYQESPSTEAIGFAKKITDSDGVIIVTPEYNGGYPSSLKNAIDLLHREWHRKPIAISTVSDGNFGGSQALIGIQFVLWKIRAWTVPALFPVPDVTNSFDEVGNPADRQKTDKRASSFISELLWCVEAKRRMEENAS